MSNLESNTQNVISKNEDFLLDNKLSTNLNVKTVPNNIKNFIILSFIQNIPIYIIRKELHKKHYIITNVLENAGVIILDKSKKTNTLSHLGHKFWKAIDPNLSEVLIGELLGDGFLHIIRDNINGKKVKSTNRNRPSLEEYKVALDYLADIQNLTEVSSDLTKYIQQYNYAMNIISSSKVTSFGLETSLYASEWVRYMGTLLCSYNHPCRITEVKKKDKRRTDISDGYTQILLTSVNSIQLGKLYDVWYPEGVKIIPKNFIVTPTILLHFFIGDGYVTKAKLRSGESKIIAIKLCTDCFIIEDIMYLAGLINTVLHINTILEKKKKPTSIHYRITIQGYENVKKFYQYIEQANPTSVSLAKKVFPWKFKPIPKKEYLEKIKAQNNS